jgi:nicotinamidase-related amidase
MAVLGFVFYLTVPNAFGRELLLRGENLGGRNEQHFKLPPQLPPDWEEIAPDIAPQDGDVVIVKPAWDAFVGTSLDHELRQRRVTQIL